MPTPPGEPGAQLFSGIVSKMAREGKSASQVQQAVSEEAARLGVTTSFQTRTDVSRLFGKWTGVRQASQRLAGAPATDAIMFDYIGQLPYGAGRRNPAAPREFHVRVPYTDVRFGVQEDTYLTLRYGEFDLPATVGELRSEALDIVSALVPSYSAELVSVGDIELGEV